MFDTRRSLPPGYPTGLPPLADADPDPSIDVRPYYVYGLSPSLEGMLPASDVAVRRTVPPAPGTFLPPVLTTTLESARYDPATKTCTSVACHLTENPRWGTPIDPMCTQCHGY